jgi:hypothetical protein
MLKHFELKKRFTGRGARLIPEFLMEMQTAFFKRLIKYAEYRLVDLKTGGFEHAFSYGEQRTKGFISGALDEVCNSNFIQEYGIERDSQKKTRSRRNGNGRVDYWCEYGSANPIDVLLEVKQYWARYHSERKKMTHYSNTHDLHQEAVDQLRKIKNRMDYTNGALFGVAMTVIPVSTDYPKKNSDPARLGRSSLERIAAEAMKAAKAHGYGYLKLPPRLSPIETFSSPKKSHENFPAVLVVYSVTKFHRS